MEERYKELAAGNNDILGASKLVLIVINSLDMLDELCADSNTLKAIRNINNKFKSLNVVMIVGSIDNKTIPYTANEIIKKIKDDKHIIFFDDIKNLKLFDIQLSIMRQFSKKISLGDGYLIYDNEIRKFKSVLFK